MKHPSGPPPGVKRGTYIVDRQLQFGFLFHFIGSLLGIAALYVMAVYVLPGRGALEELSADEIRTFLMRSNLVYFVIALGLLATLSVLLTHRVAGPARVIENAVDGIRTGDFDRRLTLRKRDYMKGLAAAVAQLSVHLRKANAERLTVLRAIDRCLEENDLPAARELLHQLGLPEEAPADPRAPAPRPTPTV